MRGLQRSALLGVRVQGLDYDFARGRYGEAGPFGGSPRGLTGTRAGAGTARTASGVMIPYGADVPRIPAGRGLLLEEARTNKVTVNNANPADLTGLTKTGDAAAVLSVVDDSAALAAAGLSAVCSSGKVFKLDNSAGAATAQVLFSGQVGNLNPHAMSIYARGAGSWRYGVSVGFVAATAAPSTWTRVSTTATPTAVGQTSGLIAMPGAVIYFVLPQLEEGAFATSTIVTTGAAAARPGDAFSLAWPSIGSDIEVAGSVEFTGDAGASQYVFMAHDGTDANVLWVRRTSAGLLQSVVTVGGASTTLANLSLGTGARTADFALRRAAGLWTVTIDGAAQAAVAAGLPPLTAIRLGATRSGGVPLDSYLRRLAVRRAA